MDPMYIETPYIYIYIYTSISKYVYIIYLFSNKLNYYAWKIRQPLHMTYETTRQLFRSYEVTSAMYTVISPTGDWTSNHRAKTLPFSFWSTSHTSDAELTSYGKCAAN